LKLADAYQTDGQTDPALGAYQQYLTLKPKDVDTITLAAGLYESRAVELSQLASYWNALSTEYQPVNGAIPSSASKLQSAFPSPVVTSVQGPLQTKASTYQQQSQGDVKAAIALWERAIVISPDDSSYDRALYRDALAVSDYTTAYGAVKAVLRLEPSAPDKSTLLQLESQLKPLVKASSSSSSSGSTGP